MSKVRDHGGGLDGAIAAYGGDRDSWIDLSTGINPLPYPIPDIPARYWTDLPDADAQNRLIDAARRFWQVPDGVGILPTAGVSQLIAALPRVMPAGAVRIDAPTYNEHAAAFRHAGWRSDPNANARVIVHPNNPDGVMHTPSLDEVNAHDLFIIDESFCDTCPEHTLMSYAAHEGVIVLKGLGKFWGLAGLRLGFAMAHPAMIEQLSEMIGPWAVSGPAQLVGASALSDLVWAKQTRKRLAQDAPRLDQMMIDAGNSVIGGTNLFRLYQTPDATRTNRYLAQNRIWSRCFPYSKTWVRLGIPGQDQDWQRLSNALDIS
ncbi:threonine-phosphate decarboxylase [Amylibacter marinus]|uniref:Aminotransferase n=1 Tax=Amylibacter marinus TaxID=1475483 RepID=A0ABQ5VW04_9RHOB|nr:threonine-phosphate decarboxylase [Amylibacter marinus]GLQ35278.1 threonine-phosphate decarboxylase [Amylibacter marinus]